MYPRLKFKEHWFLALLLLGCAAAGTIRAQTSSSPGDNSSGGIIRGRVVLPNGGFLNEEVRITLQTIRGVDSSVYTDNTGRFEFSRLAQGKYQVIAEGDRERFEITSETVEILGARSPSGSVSLVTIVLKEKARPGQPKAASVSATELDSNVPSKARKEFERASTLNKEGKSEEAIEHLRKAISLYPRYLMAHNDLGAQLLELGRLDDAERELRIAVSLDQAAFNPILNLGIVLIKKQQFSEARDILEKAISLQAQAPIAHFYCGVALLGTSEFDRAEKEFLAAHDLGGAQYAMALFHLGQLYMDRGDRNRARESFQRYLREAPNASNSAQVRKLIAMLE
jgi:Flp pilus assembly protein TadD